MIILSVYCKSCNKDTGLAAKIKEALKEATYNCPHCGYYGKAKEARIEEVKKEDWEKTSPQGTKYN